MNLPKQPPVHFGGPEAYPLFSRISLETISYCNRVCSFCPIAWNDRGHSAMAEPLWQKIVAELGDLKFDGVAQMFLLSEPTIDKQMKRRLTELRAACPKVTTYASSNGDVLDVMLSRSEDRFLAELASYYEAGLTVLNLNIYDSGEEQARRFERMIQLALDSDVVDEVTTSKYSKHRPRGRFICLTDMRLESQGTAKSTDVLYIKTKEERRTITAPQKHCSRTQRHIVVRYDGKVPVCCAIDITDESVPIMGDINTQSLVEVWNGEPMFKYRYFTQQAKRVLPGCDTCTHRMAYPHIVRKVTADAETIARWEGQ